MAFERNNRIPIGTPGLPWPSMKRIEETVGGKTAVKYELAGIEDPDTELWIDSNRDYASVIGQLYRSIPVRNFLPAFEFLVARARPDQENHVVYLQSDPGGGKSTLAMLVGSLMDSRGPVVSEASGKSLENWLFETVFDTEKSEGFVQSVNKGLAENTLSPLSRRALKDFKKFFNAKNNTVNWDAMADSEEVSRDTIEGVVSTIRKAEGWSEKSTNVGFKVKIGGLVQADREGRVFVGDELNKSEPGTEAALQVTSQVLNGEMAENTVSLGGIGSHTFKRGKGCPLAVFTGNYPKDGGGTRPVSDSFARRVPSFGIPNLSKEDWQDFTSSRLSGFPLPIMQHLVAGRFEGTGDKKKWKVKNPEDLRDWLFKLSTYGMTEAQKKNVKDWQISFIGNWEKTLEASEKLGSFYHKWSELADKDSPLHKTGQLPDILLEVDDADKPVAKVTPSTMIGHIIDAQTGKPEKKEIEKIAGYDPKRNWDVPRSPRIGEKEAVATHFGTRLVDAIMNEIYRNTEGKPHLRAQLLEDAKVAGLTGKSPPLAKLLNIDPSKDKAAEAKRVQGTHAALLRSMYPTLGLSADDEELLPVEQVKAQLAAMETMTALPAPSAYTTIMQVPNTNIKTVRGKLYKQVAADSLEETETIAQAKKRLPAKDLVDINTLLTSLTSPKAGAMNLDALWNKAHTGGAFAKDEATAIAEGISSTGIATATLLCRDEQDGSKGEYVTLHVLRNSKQQRTVIVGDEPISDKLYDQLKRNNVKYINRKFNEDARAWIRSEVRGMVESKDEDDVKKAFLMANEPKSASRMQGASITHLLYDSEETKPSRPTFVTNLDPSQITHTQRAAGNSAKSRILGRMGGL